MVQSMALMRCKTNVTKPYSIDEWIQFRNAHNQYLSDIVLSCTNAIGQFEYICDVLNAVEKINKINVTFDRNHGTYKDYITMVENVRRTFPNKHVFTGVDIGKVRPKNFLRGPPANPLPYQVTVPNAAARDEEINVNVNEGMISLLLINPLHQLKPNK
jgi:hypothetical protein